MQDDILSTCMTMLNEHDQDCWPSRPSPVCSARVRCDAVIDPGFAPNPAIFVCGRRVGSGQETRTSPHHAHSLWSLGFIPIRVSSLHTLDSHLISLPLTILSSTDIPPWSTLSSFTSRPSPYVLCCS